MYLQIVPFLLKHWKLIAILLGVTAIFLAGMNVAKTQCEAEKLDAINNAVAHFNVDQIKSRSIGLDLNEGLNEYRGKARELDTKTPTGAVFDSDGVRRVSERNAAGRAAR